MSEHVEYNKNFQNSDIVTTWHEGLDFHMVKTFEAESHTTLVLKPIFIHKYSVRDYRDMGSNLLTKFAIQKPYYQQTEMDRKLSIYMDYYRLYELSAFFDKYMAEIRAQKVFIKDNGIMKICDTPSIMTHYSDKNKLVTCGPDIDENGPRILVSMSVGTESGVAEGSIGMTLTEYIVLTSSVQTLLRAFPGIQESMYNRALSSRLENFNQMYKSAITEIFQKLQKIENKINMTPLGPNVIDRDNSSSIVFGDNLSELKSMFGESTEDMPVLVKKDNEITEDIQNQESSPLDIYSVLQEFMNEFNYKNFGEVTDLFYKFGASINLSSNLYKEVLTPILSKSYQPVIDFENTTSSFKDLTNCLRGSDSEDKMLELLKSYHSINKTVQADLLNRSGNQKEHAKRILDLQNMIPRYFNNEQNSNELLCSRVFSCFLDFFIVDQLFGYINKELVTKTKSNSMYFLYNRFIIRWSILPLLWGNYISNLTVPMINAALKEIWAFWETDYKNYFEYLYSSDLVSNKPELKKIIEDKTKEFFSPSGLDYFKTSLKHITSLESNIDKIKELFNRDSIELQEVDEKIIFEEYYIKR